MQEQILALREEVLRLQLMIQITRRQDVPTIPLDQCL